MNLELTNLIDAPIAPECFVSIVVPVRDESEYIFKTIESFAGQVDLQNKSLDPKIFEVIILANNCQDNSFAIAQNCREQFPRINLHVQEIALAEECANIGFARRLLMNEAARRLKSNRFGAGIIMTTDGDTRVAPDWVAQNIKEIQSGADAVGGRILLDELAELDARTRNFHLLDEKYRLLAAEFEWFLDELPHNDFPRHHQYFNGSFAVTIDAFERAGGVPEVKFLEDVAFYNALLRIDARIRHSPQARVFTSARTCGRTALGLSTQLYEWEAMGENGDVYLVETAQSIEKRITARKKIREIWRIYKTKNSTNFEEIKTVAESLGVSENWLAREILQTEFFGSLMEKISSEQNKNSGKDSPNNLISVETAIFDLERKLKEIRPRVNALIKTV